MDPDTYLGEIRLFAFPRIPTGWLPCAGQLVDISQYDALYTLLGTTYGGDGITKFGLPDLRGRVPISRGNGPNLPPFILGQMGGVEAVQLVAATMATHGHAMVSTTNPGSTTVPGPTVHIATDSLSGAAGALYAPPQNALPFTPLAAQSVGFSGGASTHDNLMPTLIASYCIAWEGIYPTPN